MKKCIWCLREEAETLFNRIAHTIPQSLGGKQICKNVCDECNSFFGNHHQGLPPIETIIKETFNITRARCLGGLGKVGKNKSQPRVTSIYFNISFEKKKIELKGARRFEKGYREKICRQIKKGLFKIYLEETERQFGNGHNGSFDFIREFARRDIGDYPVFYFYRRFAMIADIGFENPELHIDENYQMKYLVREPGFFEFELLGHVFGIPIVRPWELTFDSYIDKSMIAKQSHFTGWKAITQFDDIDLTLNLFNN